MSLHAAPVVDRTADSIEVDLGDNVRLSFALHGDWLLGLRSASVDGVGLSSGETVQRPLVAQEYIRPGIWPFLRLRSVAVEDGSVRIETELYGGDAEELFREEFVFGPDEAKALGEGITPELAGLRDRHDAAVRLLNPLVAEDSSLDRIRRDLDRFGRQLAEAAPDSWEEGNARIHLERRQRWLADRKRELYAEAVTTDEQRQALADVQTFRAALRERAMEVGSIHRDYYAFAHLRLPSETSRIDILAERIARHGDALRPGGTLVWILRPKSWTVAGWPWRGWTSAYEVRLTDGHQVNNLRQIGTWEIGGAAPGLTVVNLRYRGLGGIEETFEAAEDGNGVRRAWTTTEILPGAAGGAPLVSPVVPPPAERTIEDRGYALQHRVGAWISKLGRGSGVGFVDFQHRDGVSFVSTFRRQGAHRAVTEIFPGDRELSQTDEQWFANTDTFATEPQVYLVLNDREAGAAHHEMATRWREMDQHVRDLVSDDLGFVQIEPRPGVGWLHERGRPEFYRGLAESGISRWREQGVRKVVTHTPGWYTEQHRDGPDRPSTPGGNSNRIFDWIITDDVKADWRRVMDQSRELDIPYLIYLGGMARPDGPFAEEVGRDPARWGMNVPGAGYSHGYPPLAAHNLYVEATREGLTRRLLDIQRELGMQGLWCDSFQNMFMSQLNWGDGSGAPIQAVWWPTLAAWSRKGIHLMSESHAFPGLSCSIEVSGWEDAHLYFQYVWKWHRGTSQRNYTPEQHDEMTFRFMANKSWLAPDNNPGVIPSFRRYSDEYMAALPLMRRSWVLPDGRGVLWLHYEDNREGVWFAYQDQPVPDGTTARPVLGGDPAGHAQARHTYRVSGADLLASFGLRASPQADDRLGRSYDPPAWVWTEAE